MRTRCRGLAAFLAVTAALWFDVTRGQDRVDVLPPIDFNLEEDFFANEPVSDVDPGAAAPGRGVNAGRGRPPQVAPAFGPI